MGVGGFTESIFRGREGLNKPGRNQFKKHTSENEKCKGGTRKKGKGEHANPLRKRLGKERQRKKTDGGDEDQCRMMENYPKILGKSHGKRELRGIRGGGK